MKNRILASLIFSFFALSLLSGCKGKEDDPAPTPQSTIKIISVTPSTGLVDGQSTSFDVEVEYNLKTSDQGELNVGFNTNSPQVYSMDISASHVVARGTGTYTFTVTATPKNWGGTQRFQAYVNLAKYPHAPTYYPVAGDTENLSF